MIRELPVPGDEKLKRNKRLGRTVSVNIVESPLGWLRTRGHLTQRQFDAGEQLRSDWEAAQLAPCVTMRWDPSPIGSGRSGGVQQLEPAERQIRAKQRFEAAISAAGSGLSDILWRVVCAGEGMREAETALGWPVRAGKLVLTLALDRVADHYRLR
jgi:hypothetical protein